MIPARIAAAIVLTGGWRAVELLAGRLEGVGLVTSLALAGGLAWGLARARHSLSGSHLAATLLGMAGAGATGVALLQMGATVAALLLCAMPRPQWSLLSLAVLALPVLPTLDVLLAWPLRRISALITVAMLRLNGVGVGLEGVALEWHGQQLLFDGPCSGIRMLWAMLVLGSLIGFVHQLSAWRLALLLGLAVVAAVLGNALRAASLFYLESGFVPALSGPVVHEAVGLAAFAIVGCATLAMLAGPRSAKA